MHRPCPKLEPNAAFDSVASRRQPEPIAIGAAEVNMAREPGSNRNFGQGEVRLRDQAATTVW